MPRDSTSLQQLCETRGNIWPHRLKWPALCRGLERIVTFQQEEVSKATQTWWEKIALNFELSSLVFKLWDVKISVGMLNHRFSSRKIPFYPRTRRRTSKKTTCRWPPWKTPNPSESRRGPELRGLRGLRGLHGLPGLERSVLQRWRWMRWMRMTCHWIKSLRLSRLCQNPRSEPKEPRKDSSFFSGPQGASYQSLWGIREVWDARSPLPSLYEWVSLSGATRRKRCWALCGRMNQLGFSILFFCVQKLIFVNKLLSIEHVYPGLVGLSSEEWGLLDVSDGWPKMVTDKQPL